MFRDLAPGAAVFASTLGPWGLTWTRRGVDSLALPDLTESAVRELLERAAPGREYPARPPAAVRDLARRVRSHLAGKPDDFRDVPLDLERLPPFARKVSRALCRVPPGATVSYAELAKRAGSPGASRAVGTVMARNPLPLLVPCHRVLAADGALGGFSAPGGTDLKVRLLHREGVVLSPRHQAGMDHLARSDRALGRVIRRAGPYLPAFGDKRDPYDVLVTSIVHQQLALKAAATIARRVRALTPGDAFPTPQELPALSDAELRGAGLSSQKIGYLRDLGARLDDGRLDLRALRRRDDAQATAALCTVRGIGVWTAQMMLIFHLGRLDVWPVDDLGLQKGVQKHLGLAETPRAREMAAIGERWAPYRSLAAWYLWQLVDGGAG
ncbi:MAG: methylated-DNA--[protein]-cysteine S-methyltransferase [Candidatus Latescibacteria bacterium]|nr:methylated-DNA--[protein]-cysteine S-methyltransferase [Candidatus Latescibacterota bacterium]